MSSLWKQAVCENVLTYNFFFWHAANTVVAKEEEVANLQESVPTTESKSDLINTSTVMPNADVSSKEVRCTEYRVYGCPLSLLELCSYCATWCM